MPGMALSLDMGGGCPMALDLCVCKPLMPGMANLQDGGGVFGWGASEC